MKPTQKLHQAGQSLWLDNITRDLLTDGTLRAYIDDLGITGLTSNPTIFDHAFRNSESYDGAIRAAAEEGLAAEEIFFRLAIEDLQGAADHFRPVWDRTNGIDGWVSLEVSPRLARDPDSTLAAAVDLSGRAARPNLFIKIPGTPEGLAAIEEAIFAGVPVNVTLLFSREQYLAAADAYMRGVERRVEAGRDPAVGSVASVFVSRWDTSPEAKHAPEDLRNALGIAQAKLTYRAYRELLDSPRWGRLANEGAQPQRLLWASTGTKDPEASDVLYVRALAAPFTINTMPEKTLLAFGDHGEVTDFLPADGGDAEEVAARFTAGGADLDALAARLQSEGADAFVGSWDELLKTIEERSARPRGPAGERPLRSRPAWQALEAHHALIAGHHLRELFAEDPGRGERLTAEGAGLFLDYSKNRVTDETWRSCSASPSECGLRERIDAMFSRREDQRDRGPGGAPRRAARAARDAAIVVDGADVVPEVHEVLDRMSAFADRVRGGEWTGATGRPHPQRRQHRHRRLRPRAR